jgi:hypothetical protein
MRRPFTTVVVLGLFDRATAAQDFNPNQDDHSHGTVINFALKIFSAIPAIALGYSSPGAHPRPCCLIAPFTK